MLVLCQKCNRRTQKIPCVFRIVAAGESDTIAQSELLNSILPLLISLSLVTRRRQRPIALQNCSVSNQSIHVECVEGFDGGLPQMFLLEMVEIPTLKLVRRLTLYVSITSTSNQNSLFVSLPTIFRSQIDSVVLFIFTHTHTAQHRQRFAFIFIQFVQFYLCAAYKIDEAI